MGLLEEFAAGFVLGFAGLVAFLHTNSILQLSSQFLPQGFSKAVFASSLSFSKLVFELIPTIFFFIPSFSYGVSILPAQKLFYEGKGLFALKTILASFFHSMVFSILLLPLVLLSLPVLNSFVSPIVGWILLLVVAASLFSKEKRWASVFAFLLSGALGLVLFSKPLLQEPLFPLLSGLFGIPAIFFSLNSRKPPQREDAGMVRVDLKIVFMGVGLGALSGLLPAMSPVFLVSLLFLVLEPLGESVFIQASASTLVSKTFFDFVAFNAIGKARSGAVAFASSELADGGNLLLALTAGAASLFLAIALMLLLYRRFSALSLLGGNGVSLAVLALVFGAVFYFNGFLGLFVLAVSACVGVCTNFLGVNKTTLLGALLLPSLAFYFSFAL